MNSISHHQTERNTHRVQASRDELVDLLARALREDGEAEPLKGLYLNRASSVMEPLHSMYSPVFCVIAQGSKEVFLSNERYVYDPSHYLLVTAELPLVSHVLEASKEQPYLALRLELDPTLVGSIMVEAGDVARKKHTDVKAVNVSSLEAGLLDAVVRLVRLLEAPTEAPFLAPLITREIVYRLWMSEQRERLRHIAASGSPPSHAR